MSEPSGSKQDRRQSPRTKLVEIAYLGMGPENGGLVLDVSEGGLSFHSVAPIVPNETIRFLLSLHGHSRIEGAGEVVWTDSARTVCGLKFTSLSSGAREHLNTWTNASRIPAPVQRRPDISPAVQAPPEQQFPGPQAPVPYVAEPQVAEQEVEEPQVQGATERQEEQREEEPALSMSSQLDPDAEPLFAIPPADRVLLSDPARRPNAGGNLFYWILFVLVDVALIASAYFYGIRTGQSGTGKATQSEASPAAQTESTPAPSASLPQTPADQAPLASAATAPAAPVPGSIPNVAPSAPGDALRNASKTGPAAANPAQNSNSSAEGNITPGDQRVESPADAGKTQLAAAMDYLNGTDGHRDTAKAAKQLWAAVGNGNSDAEIVLAGLYASGDGVAKSCEQGRVLLFAAMRTGNPKAKLKWEELNARGCK